MTPSNAEKLIIAMLCDIMKQQGSSTGLDPDFIQESVRLGQEWAIEWKYTHIFASSNDETPSEVINVFSILNMYSNLKSSFKRLDGAEKESVIEKTLINDADFHFPGFDIFKESNHVIIAKTLIEDISLFDDLRGTPHVSDRPMMEKYQRQYAEHKNTLDSIHAEALLDKESIIRILNT